MSEFFGVSVGGAKLGHMASPRKRESSPPCEAELTPSQLCLFLYLGSKHACGTRLVFHPKNASTNEQLATDDWLTKENRFGTYPFSGNMVLITSFPNQLKLPRIKFFNLADEFCEQEISE